MDRWRIQESKDLWLRRLLPTDIDPVVDFAGRAFNDPIIAREIQHMLHIYCTNGVYDQRMDQQKTMLPVVYYLLVDDNQSGGTRLGLTGLYTMAWAGKGVYWLGWFAVDPLYQGLKLGYGLLWATLELAASWGGRLICIETASHLNAALGLYHCMGFVQTGEIPDYWATGENLLILSRSLLNIPIKQDIPYDF